MRAAWLIALCLLAGCKDKSKPVITVTKSIVTMVTPECELAIDRAAKAPLDSRPRLLLDSCQVCAGDHGALQDWGPLLQWNADPASGGPRTEQIEHAMVTCDAFCTGDAKMKFMAGVDKARGQSVNTPWRQLADACKAKVNAAPDPRFMSAPFFALDRIARAVAGAPQRPGQPPLADKLAALELPLPALTVSGAGVELPEVAGASLDASAIQITVLAEQIYVGTLPRAKLTANGVQVDLGTPPYPGVHVELNELAAKLQPLIGSDRSKAVTLLAPQAMRADKLVDIIAAASALAPVYLAGAAPESPPGWQLAGTIPIGLEAGHDIEVTAEMTVQNLARELAARAARKESKVGVTKH